MKNINLIKICFLMLLISSLLFACGSTPKPSENIEDIKEEIKELIENKYVVNATFYQIIDLSTKEQPFGPYYYKISNSSKVFAEDTLTNTPIINYIDNSIIKLSLSYGSNSFSAQYFDVSNDKISEEIHLYSPPAEHVDAVTNECLIAYFKLPNPSEENILFIKDIFNAQGFSTEITKGFISATCNRLIFLNENEIYLDYDVLADGYTKEDIIADNPVEYKNIREILKFR